MENMTRVTYLKKIFLLHILILSFIYQNDVANMNFYNIKIVILSDK